MVPVGGIVVCVDMSASGTVVAGNDPMSSILNDPEMTGSLTGSQRDMTDALPMAVWKLLNSI